MRQRAGYGERQALHPHGAEPGERHYQDADGLRGFAAGGVRLLSVRAAGEGADGAGYGNAGGVCDADGGGAGGIGGEQRAEPERADPVGAQCEPGTGASGQRVLLWQRRCLGQEPERADAERGGEPDGGDRVRGGGAGGGERDPDGGWCDDYAGEREREQRGELPAIVHAYAGNGAGERIFEPFIDERGESVQCDGLVLQPGDGCELCAAAGAAVFCGG